jgi:hypothetical protein
MSVLKSMTIFSAAAFAAGLAFTVPVSAAPSLNTNFGVSLETDSGIGPQLVHLKRSYHCHPTKYKMVHGRYGQVKRTVVTPAQCHAGQRRDKIRYGGSRHYRY